MSKITRFGAQKHTETNTGNLSRYKIKLRGDRKQAPLTEEALVYLLLSSALLFRITTVPALPRRETLLVEKRDYLIFLKLCNSRISDRLIMFRIPDDS